jgi:hypothetical protein
MSAGTPDLASLLGGGGGGAPAPSIPLPGGPGANDQAAPPDAGGGNPEDLVSQGLELIRQAIPMDPDEEDKLLLEKITTMCQDYIARQQKLVDTATGAGPGAKLVRKASGGGGGY